MDFPGAYGSSGPPRHPSARVAPFVMKLRGSAPVSQHGDPFAKPRVNVDPYPEEYQAYLHWGALHGIQDNPHRR